MSSQDHAKWLSNSSRLADIIRPIGQPKYGCDVEWRDLGRQLTRYRDTWGGLDLNPDFQRGHVWTNVQQQKFIESVLRGAVSASALHIQWNCPNWENDHYDGDLPLGFQCMDGLQRLTAVTKFMASEVRPFGLTVEDLDCSRFQIKSAFSFRFQVFCFERKVDVLNHYLDFNDGGVAHSQSELDRVMAMRDEIASKLDSTLDDALPDPSSSP